MRKPRIEPNLDKPASSDELWPNAQFGEDSRFPHILFIFTPSYSGSTVFAKILNSANRTALLHPIGEGQRLVPGMCTKERWNPKKAMNWSSITGTWHKKFQSIEAHVGPIDLLIEKSPPNLVRANELLSNFPNSSSITFNRNPFANCSSALHRSISRNETLRDNRIETLRKLAQKWVFRSTLLKQITLERSLAGFTYEEFCGTPGEVLQRLKKHVPQLKSTSHETTVKIKDYPIQGIENQNPRQLSKLSEREMDAVSEILRSDEELLQFFGYSSDWRASLGKEDTTN